MEQTGSHRPLWKRALSRVGILTGTAATAALAVGLVAVGSGMIAQAAKPIIVEEAAPRVPVETQALEIVDGYTVDRAFIGQVEAEQTTDLAFELGGTVEALMVDEGDRVAAGDVLARLDTRALEAERAAQVAARQALEAQAELARRTTGRREALEERGFSSTQVLDQARFSFEELQARIAQTDAVITGIDVRLDKAVLRAPFDGLVAARLADVGATMGGGAPALRLLEDTAPRMRLGLPPRLADRLSPGETVAVEIDGTVYTGRIERLRADLDPATRTRSVLIALDAKDGAPVFGRTGRVTMSETVASTGAWVPTAALQQGPRGLWTVLTVGADGTVAREAVEMIHAETDRAFVRGTFADGARLIVGGPHRVAPGQRVAGLEG